MIIHTQFDVQQRVWIMYLNKPIEVRVTSVNVHMGSDGRAIIKYSAANGKDSRSWQDHPNVVENDMYLTRGELMAAVFNESVE